MASPSPSSPSAPFRAYAADMPFDPAQWLDAVPKDALTRGMFFQNAVDALKARGCDPISGKWVAFKQYTVTEYLAFLLAAAERYCPNAPPAQGLYELGHSVYPHFASTMVGRAIFAVAGVDMQTLIKVSPRAYAAANTHGACVVHKTSPRAAHWSLDGVWDFHPYSIGIAHGAFAAVHATDVDLVYAPHAANHIEFRATWTPKGKAGASEGPSNSRD